MSKEVMKLALEALENHAPLTGKNAITALREALAEQPIQQRTEELLEIFKDVDQCGPLLGMGQPAQQEPVGKIVDCDFVGNSIARFERHLPFGTLLYTSPPAQRTWVGLTNQEREAVIDNSLTPACVVLATEAKLKEKNT